MIGLLRRSPGDCIVCGTAHCACPGSKPDSPQVQRLISQRGTWAAIRKPGGGFPSMAKTPKSDAPAGITGITPGESNARAVRDGMVRRENGQRVEVGRTTAGAVAQPVNTGEDIATSDADVQAARKPARARKAAPRAKAAKGGARARKAR